MEDQTQAPPPVSAAPVAPMNETAMQWFRSSIDRNFDKLFLLAIFMMILGFMVLLNKIGLMDQIATASDLAKQAFSALLITVTGGVGRAVRNALTKDDK